MQRIKPTATIKTDVYLKGADYEKLVCDELVVFENFNNMVEIRTVF